MPAPVALLATLATLAAEPVNLPAQSAAWSDLPACNATATILATPLAAAACIRSGSPPVALSALYRAIELAEAAAGTHEARPALNVERRVVMAAAYAHLDATMHVERSEATGEEATGEATGEASRQVREAVGRLARAYGVRFRALHGAASARTYYLHVSKAAGSTMCDMYAMQKISEYPGEPPHGGGT